MSNGMGCRRAAGMSDRRDDMRVTGEATRRATAGPQEGQQWGHVVVRATGRVTAGHRRGGRRQRWPRGGAEAATAGGAGKYLKWPNSGPKCLI